MRRPLRPSFAVLMALVWGCVSCAHAVDVRSNPPGAEVTLNGIKLGQTPVSFTDEASTGKSYQLVLRKPGFVEQRAVLRQELKGVRVGVSVVAGLFLILPFMGLLWSWELPDEAYQYELQPVPAPVSPRSETPPAAEQ